jgi:hypothetical protein
MCFPSSSISKTIYQLSFASSTSKIIKQLSLHGGMIAHWDPKKLEALSHRPPCRCQDGPAQWNAWSASLGCGGAPMHVQQALVQNRVPSSSEVVRACYAGRMQYKTCQLLLVSMRIYHMHDIWLTLFGYQWLSLISNSVYMCRIS